MRKRHVEVEKSQGNVFADLGLPEALHSWTRRADRREGQAEDEATGDRDRRLAREACLKRCEMQVWIIPGLRCASSGYPLGALMALLIVL
jgi:hypothetical protein